MSLSPATLHHTLPAMTGPLRQFVRGRTVLLVVAAPAEAAAIRSGAGAPQPERGSACPSNWPLSTIAQGVELLETGVGKVNAAAAIAHRADPVRHAAVINLGICGSLVPPAELPLGAIVLATQSVYGDEGVATPTGFDTLPKMGFPFGPFPDCAIPAHPAMLAALAPLATATGPIATVSTCSGTDALAAEVARRTDAIAEAMEGAAIAHTLARLHPAIPFAEIRVVSNSTGDRPRQQWDIRGAFARLSELCAELLAP